MGWFWGMPRGFQYAAAISISLFLAVPVVFAMFLVLTFGLGALWVIGVMAIVFGAPLWLFVHRPTETNREKRAHAWHVWRLCLVVHVGASAGMCRAMDHLPNAPQSSEGRSFAADYVGTLLGPVSILWVLATSPSRSDASVTEFTP